MMFLTQQAYGRQALSRSRRRAHGRPPPVASRARHALFLVRARFLDDYRRDEARPAAITEMPREALMC